MLTFPLGTKVDIEKIRSQMSEFMIKDYVKSAKGTELPSRISSAISQQQLDEYLEIFYRYRGDLLTGGICIKEYVELKTFNGRHNESSHCISHVYLDKNLYRIQLYLAHLFYLSEQFHHS